MHIAEAQPGDTLRVDVCGLETADWGWSALIPGFGLLADEFPEPALKVWKLVRNAEGEDVVGDGEYGYAWFDEEKGIRIPLKPFCGEMGVAPGKEGAHSTIPPYATGGNIDTRHLTAGSTLYLPIEVPGALFSIGVCVTFSDECELKLLMNPSLQDGHAAQGDGEVCGRFQALVFSGLRGDRFLLQQELR